MRTIAAAVLTAILTLGLAVAPAFAKGPTAATVEGPGIEGRHLMLPEGDYAELGRLTEVTGFWNIYSDRGLSAEPPVPENELGPSYTVRWQMGTSWIETLVYPFASTPAMHLPEEAVLETGRARGGWTTGSSEVRSLFEQYGAVAAAASTTPASKATDTSTEDDSAMVSAASSSGAKSDDAATGSPGWAAYGVVGILAALALGALLLRRRGRAPLAMLRR